MSAAPDIGSLEEFEPSEFGPQPPEFSDEALALRFAAAHANDLRYVAAWGKWLEWDGTRWQFDNTLRAFDLARAICRNASSACNKSSTAASIASGKTVSAVERLARSDRRLAATIDQWDADPWLLNTPGGTIDLRTSAMRPHRREDYCTKITATAPGAECPRWFAFLDRITGGDRDLAAFLRRVVGYALTGITREHALFFGHGTGANGKSVFISTVSGILGDYAITAPMEVFVASNSDRHPTEIADLRGARLVTASETEEGRRWNETRIKTLTGGDKVKARFMRQDFFEFTPQFKLLIVGNHKPGLRGVDEAIRRRMNLIPFVITIPENERDEQLTDKLREEWPGILQWMVDGCAEWQGDGLAQPKAVREATDAYLAAEDVYAVWMSEQCTIGANERASASGAFKSWTKWATAAGEFVGSQKRFSQALEDRGFVKAHTMTGRQFQGFALLPDPDPVSYWDHDK